MASVLSRSAALVVRVVSLVQPERNWGNLSKTFWHTAADWRMEVGAQW